MFFAILDRCSCNHATNDPNLKYLLPFEAYDSSFVGKYFFVRFLFDCCSRLEQVLGCNALTCRALWNAPKIPLLYCEWKTRPYLLCESRCIFANILHQTHPIKATANLIFPSLLCFFCWDSLGQHMGQSDFPLLR